MPSNWRDPDNVQVPVSNSNPLNFMSYFFCTPKQFSPDQKFAMKLDNISRGHHLIAPPYPLTAQGTASAIWPETNTVAHYTAFPTHFRWTAADSSNMYLIEINQTLNGGAVFLQNKYRRVAFGTEAWFQLEPNKEYTWRVYTYTKHGVCSNSLF